MKSDANNFWHCANVLLRKQLGVPGSLSSLRAYRAHCGVTPPVCATAWNMIGSNLRRLASPTHMLWALLFLKTYDTEEIAASRAGVSEKTYRRSVWYFVDLLATLPLINWEDRVGSASSEGALVSIDDTDCRIQEPSPFNKKWYSYKFNGPGVRYEIGIAIESGTMVWLHGPFPCGEFSDLIIFRSRLRRRLHANEKVIADRGYRDERCVNPYSQSPDNSRFHSVIRARHETLNRRLKQFSILRNTFRHNLSLHGTVFFAVANLTELMLRRTDPLFSITLP